LEAALCLRCRKGLRRGGRSTGYRNASPVEKIDIKIGDAEARLAPLGLGLHNGGAAATMRGIERSRNHIAALKVERDAVAARSA
jgi:hypothetical protein